MAHGGRLGRRLGWPTRWGRWLALFTALGLVIRILAVLGRPDRVAGGDAYYYHNAANLLVDGMGWINPFLYYGHHQVVGTAAFPPGFVLTLASASLVGLKSYFAHRIWCAVLGAAAVAACGYAGREIAGERAGLLAALVVAVYPNIWMSDEIAMSETLSPILVSVILLLAYRFWKRPRVRSAAWLGLSIGVAAMARDELSLLGLFVLLPIVLIARRPWKERAAMAGTGVLCALVVVAPWVGYNLSRFDKPVFISTGLGPTLASTNCAAVYSGPFEGYWSMQCALDAPVSPGADESVQSSQEQAYAMRIIRAHEGRLVPVVAARLGRGFGLFHPLQQVHLDSLIETRPHTWALLGLWMYYALAVVSVGGVVALRLRRVPVFPLLAVGVAVAVSIVLSFGDTRYRTPFEVSLAIMAAAGLDRILSLLKQGAATAPDRPGPPAGTPEPAVSAR